MLCYSRFFWQHNNLSTTTRCTCNMYSTRFKWNEENVWIKSRNVNRLEHSHTQTYFRRTDTQWQATATICCETKPNETLSMHLHGCAPSQYHRRIIITMQQKPKSAHIVNFIRNAFNFRFCIWNARIGSTSTLTPPTISKCESIFKNKLMFLFVENKRLSRSTD